MGLGDSDKGISTVDADGVALAAIQALYKPSLAKDRRIAELERRLDEFQRQLEQKKSLCARRRQGLPARAEGFEAHSRRDRCLVPYKRRPVDGGECNPRRRPA